MYVIELESWDVLSPRSEGLAQGHNNVFQNDHKSKGKGQIQATESAFEIDFPLESFQL